MPCASAVFPPLKEYEAEMIYAYLGPPKCGQSGSSERRHPFGFQAVMILATAVTRNN